MNLRKSQAAQHAARESRLRRELREEKKLLLVKSQARYDAYLVADRWDGHVVAAAEDEGWLRLDQVESWWRRQKEAEPQRRTLDEFLERPAGGRAEGHHGRPPAGGRG